MSTHVSMHACMSARVLVIMLVRLSERGTGMITVYGQGKAYHMKGGYGRYKAGVWWDGRQPAQIGCHLAVDHEVLEMSKGSKGNCILER